MSCTRSVAVVAVALFVLVSVIACKEKVAPPIQDITVAKVRGDLAGRDISGVAGTDLRIYRGMLVDLKETLNAGDQAIARIALTALDPSSKVGIQGDFELTYKADSGKWVLHDIAARKAERLEGKYAERLSELVEYPLHFAANLGNIEEVENELAKGTPVDLPEGKKLSTALMFASERGFLDIVKRLAAQGANINYQNKYGFSALHAASHQNRYEVAKFLLEAGAEVDARDHLGQTPLYFAAEKNYPELVRCLVENGANVNAKTEKGWTPLYAAVAGNALDVAKFLLQHGAQVNHKAREGYHSPLLIAAYNNNLDMVRLFLDAGADPSARLSGDHSGFRNQTALDLARERGNTAIVELLEKKSSRKH